MSIYTDINNIPVKPSQACSKQLLFLERAANIAARSPVRSHRHGCVIVKDGEIVSEGYNYHTKHMEHRFTIHAEVDALLHMKKKNVNGCELYVVRIGTDASGAPLKYSKPCGNCTKAILKAGIKKVFYSTDPFYEDNLAKYSNHSKRYSTCSSCASSSS